jgi:GT2 family glycosyltransferase
VKATVYIPTLDGGEKLERCLESLRHQTEPVHVVVADNGEGDGSAVLLGDRFPEVIRVAFGRNLGFGNALNRAIAAAGEGAIVLLNDDAVAEPELVERLLEAAGQAEMVAAALLSERDPGLIDSAGVLVDQTLMAFDYLSGESVTRLDGAPAPLGPTGGAALYARDAFAAVGGFDERMFLYYEDVDLALRMRAAGARCALAPDARAVHGYSLTLGARSGGKYARTGWSRGYLLRRYGISSRPSTALQAAAREAAICAGQLLRDRTLAGARGRLRGWRDAASLPPRELPADTVTRMSLRQALALRSGGHGD